MSNATMKFRGMNTVIRRKSHKPITVDWHDLFFGNSSTTDATIDFAAGNIGYRKWKDLCWPSDTKAAIQIMWNKLGPTKLRRRARIACTRCCVDWRQAI